MTSKFLSRSMSARMPSRTSLKLANDRTEYIGSISFTGSRLIRWLYALALQRGRADLQVGERPFEVQFESKGGARYLSVGDLVRLRFRSTERGECRDLLSIDKQSMAGWFGLNQEGRAFSHIKQLHRPWPARGRA